ncbi:MAG: DUF5683 domain-containing protein [Saprospiraceae bacterium]|nr:DUF5683 domain-containing protein [Saprospiraceae bacterium]
MRIRLLFTFLAATTCFQAFAQKPDSLQVVGADSVSPPSFFPIDRDSLFKAEPGYPDTLVLKEKKKGVVYKVFTKGYPNPRTAALLSFALPGAGQAYNKKWWKVPIVWGALGGIGYFTFDTQNTYRELRDAYKIKVNGGEPAAPYNNFDATRLKSYRDTFKGYTEKWYLALGVTYLLAVTDAFVDAHLARFDVSDDLSLRLKPSMETNGALPAFGLGISLALNNPTSKTPHNFVTP